MLSVKVDTARPSSPKLQQWLQQRWMYIAIGIATLLLYAAALAAGGIDALHDLTHQTGVDAILTFLLCAGVGVTAALYLRSCELRDEMRVRRKHEKRSKQLARFDSLTGLANRRSFDHGMAKRVDDARQTGTRLSLFMLDLDRFKEVNDVFGHAVGDTLLQKVAERIQENVRSTDFVARLGGDEFAIILPPFPRESVLSDSAGRLINSIREPFNINGHRIEIGASIGIAMYPDDGASAVDLVKRADIALYQAKDDGRNTYRFFETDMQRRVDQRHSLESDLRAALAAGELQLHYQPLYEIAKEKVVGCEALLRWVHPIRGNVSPADFIPVAEQTGFIREIGAWVLKQACSDAASWPGDLFVAVNLSARQFDRCELVADVADAISSSGLDPRRLELEVTESIILCETEAVLATLNKIKELGVNIAMDDFGTGYSSLSYLQKFPFDKIKIDRAFIDGMDHKPESKAIVRAITSMSKSLLMQTTGEGVETPEELECLRAEGCTQAQGFLLSRPLPQSELLKVLVTPERELVSA